MKKILNSILFSGLMIFFVKAQEGFPVYNSYLYDNYYALHPSIAGLAECAKLRTMTKQQWAGEVESPAIYSLSFESKINNNVGLGALIYKDKNGPTEQTGFHFTYAYHVKLGKTMSEKSKILSFALSYQGLHGLIRTDDFIGGDLTDPVLKNESAFHHNVSFSTTYINRNFFSSLTANSLLAFSKKDDRELEETNLRNYLLTAGYLLSLHENIYYEPSATLFYSESTPRKHIDINNKFYYSSENKAFHPFLTIGYRALLDDGFQSNLMSIIVGGRYKNFVFGYGYDMEIGPIKSYFGSSHQLMIGFNLFCGSYSQYEDCRYL